MGVQMDLGPSPSPFALQGKGMLIFLRNYGQLWRHAVAVPVATSANPLKYKGGTADRLTARS